MEHKQKSSITIQVFSDLHLELTNKLPPITPKCPYLFLAGDISRVDHPTFREFMRYCNAHWIKTFYIMGNHDCWNPYSNVQSIKQTIRDFLEQEQLTNVHFLDNQCVRLTEDVLVCGTTFWTPSTFETSHDAQRYINDYNMMRVKKRPSGIATRDIEPSDIDAFHEQDRQFLLTTFEQSTRDKLIVLTHFPPQQTGTSHPKYFMQSKVLKNYFAHRDRTLATFPNTTNILGWISGHTHYSYDFASPEGIRLISNQQGYAGESLKGLTRFKEDGIFEIEYETILT